MQYIKANFFFLATFSFFGLNLNAQAIEDYARLNDKYPNAKVICTEQAAEVNLKIEKGEPKVYYTTREEFFYLDDNNSGYTKRSIHFSGFYALVSYKAILYSPNGKSYKKEEIKDFKVNDFVNNNIFHDDSKELSFRFPLIEKGAKTVIETTYEIKDLHMMPKFSVSPFFDYDHVSFKVNHPNTFAIAMDTFRLHLINFNSQSVQKGNNTNLSWEGSAAKRLEFEGDGPESEYLSAQLHLRIKSYEGAKGKVNVLGNLDDLYRWNCNFLKETFEPADKYKALSDSIIKQETDTLKKIAAIFAWVQANIRYIALEAGYAGLIPAKASMVLQERYGDCKGMSNMLYNLLRSQQLPAHLVWIGSRALPYKYTELPTPNVDNHMICAVKHQGRFIFLDATSNNLPFGMPSGFIQGKEAMIGLEDCEHYTIEIVPEVDPAQNLTYDSCYIKLKGKGIKGSGRVTLTGYKRVNFIDRMSERNYNFLLKQCRGYLLKGNNRFTIDTVWLEHLEDKNKPLYIHYQFSLPEYAVVADNELFINLNLEKVGSPSKIDAKRNVPLEYNYKRRNEYVVCLEIDPLWQVNYTPKNISWEKESFKYEVEYQKQQNLLIRRELQQESTLMLYPNQFSIYNTMVEAIQKSYAEQTIIKQ
jgi:hypothetical protein